MSYKKRMSRVNDGAMCKPIGRRQCTAVHGVVAWLGLKEIDRGQASKWRRERGRRGIIGTFQGVCTYLYQRDE